MARLKSDCVKWTLVLVLSLIIQYVYSIPQLESTTLDVSNVGTEKSSEDLMRYNNRQNNDSFYFFQLFLNNSMNNDSLSYNNRIFIEGDIRNIRNILNNTLLNNNKSNRTGRFIRKKHIIRPNFNTKKETNEKIYSNNNRIQPQVNDQFLISKNVNRPVIKKVITKWTDNTKYEDLNISNENINSNEKDTSNFFINSNSQYSSENGYDSVEINTDKNYVQSNNKRYTYIHDNTRPQYSEESQVYSNNFQVIDHPYATRPNYVFTTPTPTPIITNVGYPKPWHNNHPYQPPTTKKPPKPTKPKKPYVNHNSNSNFSPYPGNDFEVTTFPPAMGYTDRIVIRPEEYSASSDGCPTIFLTLNNTFQGQGKEACPDLNIAVNTNVVNKNVVIESDEDTDTTLTDVFGLPLDDSGSEEVVSDYAESQENDEQSGSASVEGVELSSYNAANSVSETASSEPANLASPSTALTSYTKPTRPSESDDDVFSFSTVVDFFRPAINAFSWLAAINPLSFSALSFLLTPLILLFAGTSGLFALFSPWVLSGREASEVYIYRPQWQWDDYYKTWYLNSFPNSRTLQSEALALNRENDTRNLDRSTWLYKVKEFIKTITKSIRDKQRLHLVNNNRKNKRKKRETWAIRVK